jgi:hypothetical protein
VEVGTTVPSISCHPDASSSKRSTIPCISSSRLSGFENKPKNLDEKKINCKE